MVQFWEPSEVVAYKIATPNSVILLLAATVVKLPLSRISKPSIVMKSAPTILKIASFNAPDVTKELPVNLGFTPEPLFWKVIGAAAVPVAVIR